MTRGDNCVQIQRSKEVDLLKKKKKRGRIGCHGGACMHVGLFMK